MCSRRWQNLLDASVRPGHLLRNLHHNGTFLLGRGDELRPPTSKLPTKHARWFGLQVGIDYKYKFIEIDGKKVRLEIWDTAGQERFKAITRSYLRGAQGILCVYDVTDSNSYEHVSSWMLQIKQYADLKVVKVLVGNKCDLEQRRAVKFEDGQNLVRCM